MDYLIDYNQIEPKLKLLVDNHDLILNEYSLNKDKLIFKDFTLEQKESISSAHSGYTINLNTYAAASQRNIEKYGWHVAALFADGKNFIENTQHLPILTNTLCEINLLTVCSINVLDPGVSLDWHCDSDYIPGVKLLRVLWGLDIVEEENNECFIQFRDAQTGNIDTKLFKNKEFYIFHPMQEHRVENNLSTSRSIICIDYISDDKIHSIFS
jgi:hypothetical protein